MQLTWLLALSSFAPLIAAAPATSESPDPALSKRTPNVYLNFDDTKPDDVKHKAQLQSAWSNALVLAKTQLEVGFDNAIFSHYFRPEDKDAVRKVFQAISGSNPDQGSPNLGVIDVDNDDFKGRCVGGTSLQCYASQRLIVGTSQVIGASIHCCMAERASQVPELSGTDAVSCDSLGDFVNYGMMTLSSILLHEYIHCDIIGGENLEALDGWPKHVGDMGDTVAPWNGQLSGYGPYNTRSIVDKKLATRNADNYAWLALENYWTKTCTSKTGFSAPRNPTDAKIPGFCGGTPENQATQKCVIQ